MPKGIMGNGSPWSLIEHRAKSRASVFLKHGGNMQLHVSVMFAFCGNVKNASLRDSVTFPERKCQVTFPSYLSHQISAVVRFHHVSANGFEVVCYIYQNTNARWFFEQQHFNQQETNYSCSRRKYLTSHFVK